MSRPKHIKETRFEYLRRTSTEHGESNECLEWPFSRMREGYGLLVWSPLPRMVQHVRAHQLAYFLHYGKWPIPLGRHTCDNPPCYNWKHIVPGTDAENMADKVARGRCARMKGETNPASKLTDKLVLEIRRRALTERHVDIARSLGLHRKTVSRAIRGDGWPHLPGAQNDSTHFAWLKTAIAEHGLNPTTCLIWPFPTTRRGTPHIRIDGVKRPLHHAAYWITHGVFPQPTGRRTCNDDFCVNPFHIYAAKKHSVRTPSPGETNPAAKLTWPKVRRIRALGAQGLSQQSIADRYGVSQRMVSCILRETHWRESPQDADNE